MSQRNHTLALQLLADEDQVNPYNALDDEVYEIAMGYCRILKHAARHLAPLLQGKSVVVTPDGQVRCADLVVMQAVPNQKPNA